MGINSCATSGCCCKMSLTLFQSFGFASIACFNLSQGGFDVEIKLIMDAFCNDCFFNCFFFSSSSTRRSIVISSSMVSLKVRFGLKSVRSIASRVIGEDLLRDIHSSIAVLSYVSPLMSTTGSRMTACVMGQ